MCYTHIHSKGAHTAAAPDHPVRRWGRGRAPGSNGPSGPLRRASRPKPRGEGPVLAPFFTTYQGPPRSEEVLVVKEEQKPKQGASPAVRTGKLLLHALAPQASRGERR
jgi:hypothetical protein